MKRSQMKRSAMRARDTPESLAVRRDYRSKNPKCEITSFMRLQGMPTAISRYDIGVETHHIVGGSGRMDVVSNLIVVGGAWHRWIEANVVQGRILCLCVKFQKDEINAAEFRACSGQHLLGWLENHSEDCPEWLRHVYDDLCAMND